MYVKLPILTPVITSKGDNFGTALSVVPAKLVYNYYDIIIM